MCGIHAGCGFALRLTFESGCLGSRFNIYPSSSALLSGSGLLRVRCTLGRSHAATQPEAHAQAGKELLPGAGQFGQLNIDHEMAVRSAFQGLLTGCGRQVRLDAGSGVLVPDTQAEIHPHGRRAGRYLSPRPRLLGSQGRARRFGKRNSRQVRQRLSTNQHHLSGARACRALPERRPSRPQRRHARQQEPRRTSESLLRLPRATARTGTMRANISKNTSPRSPKA